jgi:putative Mg2+ transporter-C (MgtC) family protein
MELFIELVRIAVELICLAATLAWEGVANSTLAHAVAKEWIILANSRALLLLGISTLCGAMIGFEREHAAKPAGLRTNIMICAGSTLFTLASIYSWQHIAGSPAAVDPGRIAAQIVTGVGFIGAGVILRTGLHITGITTASTIWLVAAIGMVIGLGFPLLGFLVAAGATILLFLLGGIELHWVSGRRDE